MTYSKTHKPDGTATSCNHTSIHSRAFDHMIVQLLSLKYFCYTGKKKPYDGMSALEKVKASIRAKHGQGAIMDTKKK